MNQITPIYFKLLNFFLTKVSYIPAAGFPENLARSINFPSDPDGWVCEVHLTQEYNVIKLQVEEYRHLVPKMIQGHTLSFMDEQSNFKFRFYSEALHLGERTGLIVNKGGYSTFRGITTRNTEFWNEVAMGQDLYLNLRSDIITYFI